MPIKLSPLLALLAVASMPVGVARASRRFPEEIRRDLSLDYTPQCSLCHVRGNAGSGTANTPFAISARARGLTGGNQQLLLTALQAMKSDGVDSDGDGVGDIAELIAGTDPNVYGPEAVNARIDPTYGCASTGGAGAAGLIATLLIALSIGRRRARVRSDVRR